MTPSRWNCFRWMSLIAIIVTLLNDRLPHLQAQTEAEKASNNQAETVDFNQQIRPILNKHCTSCHGGVRQAGDVSFIYRQQTLDSGIIVPGEPDESELISRVTSDDPELRMPPPADHPEPLTQAQVALLRDWIAQGAPWGEHWSLRAPKDSLAAARQSSSWPRSDLDHFILRRLAEEQIAPAPEASPAEWLRRASLDLIGLPPSIGELDAFEAKLTASPDDREHVYAAEVDRLLGSEHYGERWAAMWMDLSRYADTMGFEKDPHRDMWPYRDWLIRALNEDMPFDEFTLKQLAGDLLDTNTTDDLVATAFHRNTQTNTEGGTDDEEFRVAAVIDRINTTWTVWMGTTFGCVQCHSHPYDPYRNDEYYKFMAFFNNAEDHDLDNDYPTIRVPEDPEQRAKVGSLLTERRRLISELDAKGHTVADETTWQVLTPTRAESTHGELAIRDNQIVAAGGTFTPGCRYTIEADAADCTAIRVAILPASDDPAQWPEVGSVLSRIQLEKVAADGTTQPLTFAHGYADFHAGPYQVEQSLRDGAEGFGGYPKLHGPRWAVFVLESPLVAGPGDRLRFSLLQAAQTTGNRAVPIRRLEISVGNHSEWIKLNGDSEVQAKRDALAQVEKQLHALPGPQLPVVQERPHLGIRPTRTFIRGNWLRHGDLQTAAVPAVLPVISEDEPDRRDLAKWLTAENNPLTARVLANRLWGALFGIGIVETQEDFGSTGTPPSHPELLDHLAIRLQRDHQWHWKPLLREIVLSATYRQTHRVTPELRERDPQNRWLARGPRTRLSAEMVRDQALVASGLFAPQVGGPSVMPPQPDGVWNTVYSSAQWVTPDGPDRYRRGLYTYWRRTSPYPSFLTFDAPTREFCSARRVPTNTPLQALVVLNDPAFTECAGSLATRALELAGDDISTAITWAYRNVTQQPPSDTALQQLVALYEATFAELQQECDKAESPTGAPNTSLSDLQQSALAIVTSTILNLDQALTK